ncbi:Rossmann-fold NAD(P)-binding domain-containing protein [Methylobacterium radiotolerans]|uniref:hypothetical protein n=1 Tax=Methylobacterium radiotolerans TaxID=31998 RepID=UPI00237F2F7B|nr:MULTISPECIES: hypothetical protein [Methylobacterium]MDE3748605.1 hypothetical protein [Methylobacterium radiotolerans]
MADTNGFIAQVQDGRLRLPGRADAGRLTIPCRDKPALACSVRQDDRWNASQPSITVEEHDLPKFRLGRLRVSRPRIRPPVPGFDATFYLVANPDVRAAGIDPLRHYMEHGWKEGRDPSAGFSTSGYLAADPDVAASGRNPLLHFLNDGFSEGRGGFAPSRT